MNKLNIVLVEPEIPQNTGNIARTCAATGASLHLIRPMGFEVDNAKLKRAGLDYWDKMRIYYYDDWAHFLSEHPDASLFFFTTKAKKRHVDAHYNGEVYLVFGPESRGLPEELLLAHAERCLRIPMLPTLRSLNLSNSVAVAVYEVLRQWNFDGFQTEGELHEHHWE